MVVYSLARSKGLSERFAPLKYTYLLHGEPPTVHQIEAGFFAHVFIYRFIQRVSPLWATTRVYRRLEGFGRAEGLSIVSGMKGERGVVGGGGGAYPEKDGGRLEPKASG